MHRLARSRSAAIVALGAAAATSMATLAPASGVAAPFVPGKVVVGYATGRGARSTGTKASSRGGQTRGVEASAGAARGASAVRTEVVTLRRKQTESGAIARLQRQPGVSYAVPDYVAKAASFAPNDPGRKGAPGGWQELQWNFAGAFGVGALGAWENLIADGAPGGEGVRVAVLDTGVAYENRGRFARSPDFERDQFVDPHDFVDDTEHADDANGHGTFVAGTIAEETDNGVALTGLAYGVKIMPVRVLDANGEGDASTIAEGVRYAVSHGAQVINLSLVFPTGVTAREIPELTSALAYAHEEGVVVVGAAGNKSSKAIPYPARDRYVISVGATTEYGCLADYSNYGQGVNILAPGGGPHALRRGDPNCRSRQPGGRDIFQETLIGSSTTVFGLPDGYEGTSMATPEVSAAAALVIASGVLGPHPTPGAVRYRLEATARRLGDEGDRADYGHGLLDAAAATARGGPGVATAR